MEVKATIIKGKYLDSVKLMLVSKRLRSETGVIDAVAILATHENRQILQATQMLVSEISAAGETDIAVVVKAETAELAAKGISLALELINHPPAIADNDGRKLPSNSISAAFKALGSADLCLISVAGKYAAAEADKALELGMHVLLFSDNVSLADELALKQKAIGKGLLLMGPDCGTAIINGVPLAFANAVPRGKIGLVSASGTGLQELTVSIAHLGCGISQAFGTGGRDGKQEIGGLMLCSCLEFLINDPETEVIVVMAKTPDTQVQTKLWDMIATTAKPVIVNFMVPVQPPKYANLQYSTCLAETARLACIASGKAVVETKTEPDKPLSIGKGKFIRGLYSGGTLCMEAIQLYHQNFGKLPYNNVLKDNEYRLKDALLSQGDCFIDLGADEFTVGRPHPMIDYSLRLKKIATEAQDPEVAIILLDVVLGYGANADPTAELAPVLQALPAGIGVVCHVLGTDNDPQHAAMQRDKLKAVGAMVFSSHHQAVDYALQQLKACRS